MTKVTNLKQNSETGNNDYIFSIYDNVAQIFEPPFTEKNKGTAIRRITDLINSNLNSPYAKFPDNFALHHIGMYNSSDGSILELNPEHVINFEDLTQLKE